LIVVWKSKTVVSCGLVSVILSVAVLAVGHRTIHYFQTKELVPNTELLLSQIGSADRYVILAPETCTALTLEGEVRLFQEQLFEERSPESVARLIRGIRIKEQVDVTFWKIPKGVMLPHCMCHGDFTIRLYARDSELATLGFHHGKYIRWIDGPWQGDAELDVGSGEKILGAIAEDGFPEVHELVR